MPVIDVHKPMLNEQGLALQRRHGDLQRELRRSLHALEGICLDGSPFIMPMTGHVDRDERIAAMAAKVDLDILSPTCPDVHWSTVEAARLRDEDGRCAEMLHGAASAGRTPRAAHINLT